MDCFAERILAHQALAEAAGVPFLITEYNNGLGETSRDDSSAAAFVFRQMALLSGKLGAQEAAITTSAPSNVFMHACLRRRPVQT